MPLGKLCGAAIQTRVRKPAAHSPPCAWAGPPPPGKSVISAFRQLHEQICPKRRAGFERGFGGWQDERDRRANDPYPEDSPAVASPATSDRFSGTIGPDPRASAPRHWGTRRIPDFELSESATLISGQATSRTLPTVLFYPLFTACRSSRREPRNSSRSRLPARATFSRFTGFHLLRRPSSRQVLQQIAADPAVAVRSSPA